LLDRVNTLLVLRLKKSPVYITVWIHKRFRIAVCKIKLFSPCTVSNLSQNSFRSVQGC